MNKLKSSIVMLLSPVIALAIFFALFAIPSTFVLDISIKTTIVSIMFTLLGFSITGLTIIIGFMKDSLKVMFTIKKGYIYTIVILIAWMLIICALSLAGLLFNWPSYIFVSISASGTFVVGYFIYFILTIAIFLVRSGTTSKK